MIINRHGPRRGRLHAGTGHHRVVSGQEAGGDFGERGGRNDPQGRQHHQVRPQVTLLRHNMRVKKQHLVESLSRKNGLLFIRIMLF